MLVPQPPRLQLAGLPAVPAVSKSPFGTKLVVLGGVVVAVLFTKTTTAVLVARLFAASRACTAMVLVPLLTVLESQEN